MVYTALVKRLDPQIEEEVTIEIEGIQFTGFAFICPYKIEVGKMSLDEAIESHITNRDK
jgi:hypothetical protein